MDMMVQPQADSITHPWQAMIENFHVDLNHLIGKTRGHLFFLSLETASLPRKERFLNFDS